MDAPFCRDSHMEMGIRAQLPPRAMRSPCWLHGASPVSRVTGGRLNPGLQLGCSASTSPWMRLTLERLDIFPDGEKGSQPFKMQQCEGFAE